MTQLNLIVNKVREIKEGIFTETLNKIKNIHEIANKFESTDLKVYHASYYLYKAVKAGILTSEQEISLFQEMTAREFEHFEEWEKENLHHISRSYYGQTSSFSYDTNWHGYQVENELVEQLLEGKEVHNIDWYGGLWTDIYDFLFHEELENEFDQIVSKIHEHIGTIEESEDKEEWQDDFENELDELLSNEKDILIQLNDDLNDILEIVLETQKAYAYISDYKTVQVEEAVAESHLEYEIENYLFMDLSKQVFESALEELTPLNEIETIEVTGYKDALNNTWFIDIISNLGIKRYSTEIKTVDDFENMAKLLVAMTVCDLRERFAKTFNLKEVEKQ